MAMLAEPRKKQRISLNPQGKLFLNDKDNKGRALLEKMGWKDGEGLGKTNQGISAPIKLKIQTSTKGLGADNKDDPWIQHGKNFTQILDKLNADNKVNDETTSNPNSNKPLDLESKSKSSRARIHYTKAVKSKDISKASKQDLAAIFGKPLLLDSHSKSSIKISKRKYPSAFPINELEAVVPS